MRVKVKFTRVSSYSRKTHVREIEVDPADVEAWRLGALIQDVLPYVSAPDREFIVSGITPEEWNEMFNQEDKK